MIQITTNLTFGQKIKKARLEKNFTQSELVGDFITRNMLSKIENDAANPSLKTIEYLAYKLEKPISYFLDNSLTIDNKKKNNIELAFEHSAYLFKNKEYSNCIDYIENLLEEYDRSIDKIIYPRTLSILGRCYIHVDKLDSALKAIEECIKLLDINKDHYYLIVSYLNLSYIYFNSNQFVKSENSSRKAIEILNNSPIDSELIELKLYYVLGYSLYKQLKYNEAIPPLLYSLEISKEYDCFYNVGSIHMLLGIVYEKNNSIRKAIFHTQKSITFFDFSEKLELKWASQINLGNHYIKNGDYEEAKLCLYECLKYYEQINNLLKVNTIKTDIIEVLTKECKYMDAIDYSKKIDIDIIKDTDRASIFKNLGKCYISSNKLVEAESYLHKALEILKENERLDIIYDTLTFLAELYSLAGDFKKAYEFSNKSKEILEKSSRDNK
ncbi:helix-turn-helix transcriptional regulator [Tissierella sp.]|uniref:helix-turn-helix domain-containing protein n=1 Tax=Tissierella sp. TaxID=41274 RepID=UPI002865C080|nr:helix-turn-helix transcriptional regulator [Tissierella sp.]MDR7856500.1 helix-turn-helix transcriptional regulator [Tissierella sp.]